MLNSRSERTQIYFLKFRGILKLTYLMYANTFLAYIKQNAKLMLIKHLIVL
jgi:hypothetical protein